MEFLKAHQSNIMLFMSGICFILAVLTGMTKALSLKRRRILVMLELSAMILLICDRYAYFYRGDVSTLGFWMVRISNFMVYFMTLYLTHAITLYLYDLFRNEGKVEVMPRRLWVCEGLFLVGMVLLVISQFTGLYYTFDAQNQYQRASGNLICYAVPFLITFLQASVIFQYRKKLSRIIVFSLMLNTLVPLCAAVIQLFTYGVSLINMSVVGVAIMLYVFVVFDLNEAVDHARRLEIEFYRDEKRRQQAIFEETAESLSSAIDAKDRYTHGHSGRVAIYSRQIAQEAGMSEEECERIYFVGLLHDVGKIGIADSIINKDGKLTEEEYAQIKLHPVYGNQILSRIQQFPYLSIGAHYHHERYDGKGYPDGLKGEDIPEIARIIAVADAYDAMTSKRSYRDPIPQDKVREELVKGMGTQFDPKFAKLMLHLIDLDTEYCMQEREEGEDTSLVNRLHCESIYHDCTTGILVTDKITRIHFYTSADKGFSPEEGIPSIVLFDALDGRIHETEFKKKDLLYFEYGKIRFDGQTECIGARKMETSVCYAETEAAVPGDFAARVQMIRYDMEACRYKDHALIKITGNGCRIETITALPDSARFCYISLTGEHCVIRNIRSEQEETVISPDTIPRIAEEISYVAGLPQGDIPNVQIDGWCLDATVGVPIGDGIRITFHSKSLPTARLVWHCPYISIFTAKDGLVKGSGFWQYILIRLDGENWESDEHAENKVLIDKTSDFEGWKEWKERNKEGIDCEAVIRREGNVITVTTENLGVSIRSITTIHDEIEEVYAALTGDQCAITDIHILKNV